MMKKTLLIFMVIVMIMSLTTTVFASTVTNVTYGEIIKTIPDVTETHWAATSIARMKMQKLMVGYADGSFRPTQAITGAEFIVVMTRLAGISGSTQALPTGAAIPGWASANVSGALLAGIVDANSNAVKQGDKPITRIEAAVILAKTLNLTPETGTLPFADANLIPDSAKGYLLALYKKGIFVGYPDKTFRPETAIDRAQIAVILDRTLSKIK